MTMYLLLRWGIGGVVRTSLNP